MSSKKLRISLAMPALLICTACAPQVITQPVPVSSDPPGAQVYVDGAPTCQTPCKVDLPRNQDHLLTLRKDGYRQQDVPVKRQYQSAKVMLNAINEGVRSNDFFKNAAWGINGGIQSVNQQEDTGEAYVLVPSTLSVRLAPVGGFAPAPAQAQATAKTPVDMHSLMRRMSPGDEQMLENALEGTKSGQPTVWTNPESMTHFSVVPEPASYNASGSVVRWFTLAVKQGSATDVAHAPARRVGNGEWLVDLGSSQAGGQAGGQGGQVSGTAPATFPGPLSGLSGSGQPDAPADQGAEDITKAETLRALGDAPWPTANKSWDMGSSGSTKTRTSYGADGSTSTTTTTTRTSAKASVSVGPGAAITALGALESLFSGGK